MELGKKRVLGRVVKIFLFLALFAALLHGVSYLVTPQKAIRIARTRSQQSLRVFNEPQNSLDVLVFGHSGAYSAISPMQMYKEHGIVSYVCAQPLQLPWESSRWLKGLLEVQSPKLVVFEVDQLFYDKQTSVARNSLENAFYDTFPVFRNHANWKKWLEGKKKGKRDFCKGYYYNTKVKPYTGKKELVPTDRTYKIGKRHLQALEEVYELCREQGISLMLVEVPSVIVWDYSRYNAISAYAEKRGLQFVDLNQHMKEIQFDWKTDTRDKGDHLNFSGAQKVTAFLGKEIKARYDLPDRRTDENYADWKDDLVRYEKKIQGGKR